LLPIINNCPSKKALLIVGTDKQQEIEDAFTQYDDFKILESIIMQKEK